MELRSLTNFKQSTCCLLRIQLKLTRQSSSFKIRLASIATLLRKKKRPSKRRQLASLMREMAAESLASKVATSKSKTKKELIKRSLEGRRSHSGDRRRR